MSQEKKEMLKGNEKFEEGVLTSDACMQRFSQSRETQYRTYEEDLPEQSFGRSAWYEERRLISKVYQLKNKGFKPFAGETLETFVARLANKLDEAF